VGRKSAANETSRPFAPPYGDLAITFSLANVTAGATATFTFFDGLNATGASFFSVALVLPPAVLTLNGFGFGDAVDGVFSVRATANNLPFDISSTTATAFAVPGGAPLFTVTGTIAPAASAPEPVTAALVATGLAAGFVRRRARERRSFDRRDAPRHGAGVRPTAQRTNALQ
jgi:hypothetical protein